MVLQQNYGGIITETRSNSHRSQPTPGVNPEQKRKRVNRKRSTLSSHIKQPEPSLATILN